MNVITIQRGDTCDIALQYKEDGAAMVLPTGYDLIVGLYDRKGGLVHSGSLLGGEITNTSLVYYMHIDHTTSMKMSGEIRMEITIRNTDNVVVDHASDIPVIRVDDRKNNALL